MQIVIYSYQRQPGHAAEADRNQRTRYDSHIQMVLPMPKMWVMTTRMLAMGLTSLWAPEPYCEAEAGQEVVWRTEGVES
jgi:hypothetical protein